MPKREKTQFEEVTGRLGQLDRRELEELADIVAALLQATDEDNEDDDQVEGDKPAKSGAKGHIELKMIGRCGPYKYLRYWSGGHLRSKYIGKAKGKAKE